jgi:hypothetical protein
VSFGRARRQRGGSGFGALLNAMFCGNEKYQENDLLIASFDGTSWFLYPHDEVLEKLLAVSSMGDTLSWSDRGG